MKKQRKVDDPQWRQWRASQGGAVGGKKSGKLTTSYKYTCPHCAKEGTGPTMKRWHFNNCEKIQVADETK